MEGFLLVIHIFVCLLLIVVVLLQSGKSADLAGAFGGYGSQSTFGPRSAATLLSKLTTSLAILFMCTSLLLWILSSKKSRTGSVLGADEKPAAAQTTVPEKKSTPPVTPAPPAEEQPAQNPKPQ